MQTILTVSNLSKSFVLHLHNSAVLPVVANVDFTVGAGECVVLGGPSGVGKSSILKMIYGNYLTNAGSLTLMHEGIELDLVTASPRQILDVRRSTMGYVSQFLRVIPRVPALDIVAEPARAAGLDQAAARTRARDLLSKLNLPERLWNLPPATFSGGEQQRVNIARGFAGNHGFMILDEPTASLDVTNRDAVIALVETRKAAGTGFLGIFHDDDVRTRVADRIVDVKAFAATAEHAA